MRGHFPHATNQNVQSNCLAKGRNISVHEKDTQRHNMSVSGVVGNTQDKQTQPCGNISLSSTFSHATPGSSNQHYESMQTRVNTPEGSKNPPKWLFQAVPTAFSSRV